MKHKEITDVLKIWPHYKIFPIKSMGEVKQIFFDNGETDYTLNWVFLSTSGVHGSYTTLDDIEKRLKRRKKTKTDDITILIVQPRLVTIRHGHIQISEEDIPTLRALVELTLKGIYESQEGNFLDKQKAERIKNILI